MGSNKWIGKKVVYNGGSESYIHSDDPRALVKGHVYIVAGMKPYDYQTNLMLKDVDGEFNSVWFNETDEVVIESSMADEPAEVVETSAFVAKYQRKWKIDPDYVVRAYHMPTPGCPMFCIRIHSGVELRTSTVQMVNTLSQGVLLVKTRNSVYLTMEP